MRTHTSSLFGIPADYRLPPSSDNIESNISSIAVDTAGAADELTTAHDYQRRAGRRALCLMLILVIVIAVVLLAVRVLKFVGCVHGVVVLC